MIIQNKNIFNIIYKILKAKFKDIKYSSEDRCGFEFYPSL